MTKRVRDDPAPAREIVNLHEETMECCCTAYSGILQGLKRCDGGLPDGVVDIALEHLLHVARERAAAPPPLATAAAELAGDIADACGRGIRERLDDPAVTALLDELSHADHQSLRDTAARVSGSLKRLWH